MERMTFGRSRTCAGSSFSRLRVCEGESSSSKTTQPGLHRLGRLGQLLQLSLADVGRRVGRRALLEGPGDDDAPRRVDEALELVEVVLGLGAAERLAVDPDEDRLVRLRSGSGELRRDRPVLSQPRPLMLPSNSAGRVRKRPLAPSMPRAGCDGGSGPRTSPTLGARTSSSLEVEWRGQRLDSDPLLFPHRYARPEDREVAAFLASSLAFGRVASINASLETALRRPRAGTRRRPSRERGGEMPGLDGFVHRWVDAGSLRPFLGPSARRSGPRAPSAPSSPPGTTGAPTSSRPSTVSSLCSGKERAFRRAGEPQGLRFLLPSPADGGACKRAHLFLRWMVRTRRRRPRPLAGGRFSPRASSSRWTPTSTGSPATSA